MTSFIPSTSREQTQMFLAGAFIVLSLLIASMFVYDSYYSYIAHSDELAATLVEETGKKSELDSLNVLRSEATDPKNIADIERYAGIYREDAYISTLMAPSVSGVLSGIRISGMAMDKGERLPSGLSTANVTVSFTADSQSSLISYLDYLTTGEARRRFMIRSLSFPFDTSAVFSGGTIPVSLKISSYYLSR